MLNRIILAQQNEPTVWEQLDKSTKLSVISSIFLIVILFTVFLVICSLLNRTFIRRLRKDDHDQLPRSSSPQDIGPSDWDPQPYDQQLDENNK